MKVLRTWHPAFWVLLALFLLPTFILAFSFLVHLDFTSRNFLTWGFLVLGGPDWTPGLQGTGKSKLPSRITCSQVGTLPFTGRAWRAWVLSSWVCQRLASLAVSCRSRRCCLWASCLVSLVEDLKILSITTTVYTEHPCPLSQSTDAL